VIGVIGICFCGARDDPPVGRPASPPEPRWPWPPRDPEGASKSRRSIRRTSGGCQGESWTTGTGCRADCEAIRRLESFNAERSPMFSTVTKNTPSLKTKPTLVFSLPLRRRGSQQRVQHSRSVGGRVAPEDQGQAAGRQGAHDLLGRCDAHHAVDEQRLTPQNLCHER